jgi:NitT/TauT family transport system permease protein
LLEQAKRSKKKFDWADAANVALFLAAFVGIWQAVFLSGVLPKQLMPSPATVAETITSLATEKSLFADIGITMGRLVAGFLISLGIGTGVGLVMVKFPGFGKTMSSFATGLLTFPSIAWAIFAVVLLGFSEFGIMFAVVLASVFSVMISTYSSIRNIPPIYLRAAKNMGATGFGLFRHVMIPAATPSLIIGVRQAWSFAWHALITAEIVITTLAGLGYVLNFGRDFNDMSQIIAIMIVIFVIGIVFDRILFLKLEERVRARWGLDQHS